jgi:hypothetical protein
VALAVEKEALTQKEIIELYPESVRYLIGEESFDKYFKGKTQNLESLINAHKSVSDILDEYASKAVKYFEIATKSIKELGKS